MMIKKLVVDLSPLRSHPKFRRIWVASTVSGLGGQLASFAVMFLLWEITHSVLLVGLAGLANAVPTIIFALLGGTLADVIDRRLLVLITTVGQLVAAVLMLGQAVADLRSVLVIYLLLAVQSAFGALGSPARKTFVVSLLPSTQLGAGLALTNITFQASMLAGPAMAGFLTASWGVEVCFAINVISFGVSLYAVLRLPALRPDQVASRPGIAAMIDGLRYVGRRRVLAGALLADLNATLLAMPVALFPALNAERFGGDPRTLGLLFSALAIGGLLAGLLSSAYLRDHRPGRVMLIAGAVWAISTGALAFVGHFWLAMIILAIAGAADTASVVSRGTLVQLATEDSHRGRVNSIDHVIGVAGPEIGNTRAGAVGQLTSVTASLAIGGGLALIGVALLAIFVPAIHRHDTTPPIESKARLNPSEG